MIPEQESEMPSRDVQMQAIGNRSAQSRPGGEYGKGRGSRGW